MAPSSLILEREDQLDELQELLDLAAGGTGSLALVCGEAGIGKTTLVEAFTGRMESADVPVLRGACDALRTPRPLGPLMDVARAAGGRLAAVAGGEPDRERFFGAFLDVLQRPPPSAVVVVEDLHWADLATLDLLTFLGRRIRDTSALVIATYRNDELPADHPLREVLATLPSDAVRRIALPRLSQAAVETLARRAGRPPQDIFDLTSGNPLYVNEVLAADGDAVPSSVQDAVFARANSLDASARAVLDAAALAPGRVERWLLDAVIDPDPADVRSCIDRGVLVSSDGGLSFRHELARQAWKGRMDDRRIRELHSRLLAVLQDAGTRERPDRPHEGAEVDTNVRVEAARIAHHAAGAEDATAVLRFAPVAAAEAARLGAHREAAAHYRAALDVADGVEPVDRADLLEAFARECYLVGENERAVAALQEALAIRVEAGDRRHQSEDQRWLARLAWFRGDEEAVEHYCRAAIDSAEPLGPSPELARACSTRSQIFMSGEECRAAVEWGERALEIAREVDDRETVVHALTNVGCAKLMTGDPAGRRPLEEALEVARSCDLHVGEARALLNLAEIAVHWRDVDRAEADIETAVDYCVERDMDPYALCGIGARARFRLWTGNWTVAAEDAALVLEHPRVPQVDRIPALVVLGLLRLRRGDPGAWKALQEARSLAAPTGEQQRIAPVAAARAEAAWLESDSGRIIEELRSAYSLARNRHNPWVTGELAFWLWRIGDLEAPPGDVAEPYALRMADDPEGAAEAWDRLGFPYRRALALADCHDATSAREGLRSLRALGATRVADRVARELRKRGLEHLPRGPRRVTRENPAGLTPRQLETLELLAEGLSNRQIADRLNISPKTVEHHVSAVLSKLGVANRTEAAIRAAELERD